ncbi:hypothetical protein [Pandoraea sp. CB10b_02]|nr:hypothetical protein [Pandoraea sp. CB10b_02]
MLSPHEIATLLLAAASLGPIDADALERPDLAALEQARLVHVAVNEGQARVTVTEDGHRVLRRLGLAPSTGGRKGVSRSTPVAAQRAVTNETIAVGQRPGAKEVAADGSEDREKRSDRDALVARYRGDGHVGHAGHAGHGARDLGAAAAAGHGDEAVARQAASPPAGSGDRMDRTDRLSRSEHREEEA